jgi:hypothetical protein
MAAQAAVTNELLRMIALRLLPGADIPDPVEPLGDEWLADWVRLRAEVGQGH